MKIKSLTIKNFRGISNLIDFPVENINTFVGKNDSGKSAILRALDCFFHEKNFTEKDVCRFKRSEDKTSIEISFDPEKEIDDLILDSNRLITLRKDFSLLDSKKIKVEEYYISNDFVDPDYGDLWNKKEADLTKIQSKLEIETTRSGRGNTNLERIQSIKEKIIELPKEDKVKPLGNLIKKIEETYSLVLPEYYLFNADENLNIESADFQSNFKPLIVESLKDIKETTTKIEEEIKKKLQIEFQEIKRFMEKNAGEIREIVPSLDCDWKKAISFDMNFVFEGEKHSIPISHKGTGFKRLLMVAYLEYLASKSDITNRVFAIEEPETYLHPSAQDDLLKSILSMSEASQFFLTTHSPIFAGAVKGKNSILVRKNQQGISEYKKGEEIIPDIIGELGIKADYNLLNNLKHIIFVEGDSDIEFVKIAAKKICGKTLRDDGIGVMIGGGSSLKNLADRKLMNLLGRGSYSVMVDGDIGNDLKTTEHQSIKASCESENAIFFKLSKNTIENYCHPEAIKRAYIKKIKSEEGSDDMNPRINKVSSTDIKITPDLNVSNYLRNLGMPNIKNGINVKVFEEMTPEEWKEADPTFELGMFIESVYSKIS